MFKKLRTEIIFTLVALFSLLSIALILGAGLQFVPAVVITFGFNVWAITQSERGGFFRAAHMPRAGDPERSFHPVQTVVLIVMMFIQVAITSFQILTA